jgi:zinc transporter ZupT
LWQQLVAIAATVMLAYGGIFLALYSKKRITAFTTQCFNTAAAGVFLAMAVFHILPEAFVRIGSSYLEGDSPDPNNPDGEKVRTLNIRAYEKREVHEGHWKVEDGSLAYTVQQAKNDSNEGIFLWTQTQDYAHGIHEEFDKLFQKIGILCFCGYTVILFFDRVLTNLFVKSKEELAAEEAKLNNAEVVQTTHDGCNAHNTAGCGAHSHGCAKSGAHSGTSDSEDSSSDSDSDEEGHHGHGHGAHAHGHGHGNNHGHGHGHGDSEDEDGCDHGECGHAHGVDKGSSFVQGLMLLLALSMHGFAEGFMVAGLKDGTLLCMALCVCLHIWVETFMLSGNLLKAGLTGASFWGLASIHCMMNPLGTTVALVLKNSVGPAITVAEPYMNAFCGGTILYICLTEIVPETFCDKGNFKRSLWKLFLFGGAGALTIVLVGVLHKHPAHIDPSTPIWRENDNHVTILELAEIELVQAYCPMSKGDGESFLEVGKYTKALESPAACKVFLTKPTEVSGDHYYKLVEEAEKECDSIEALINNINDLTQELTPSAHTKEEKQTLKELKTRLIARRNLACQVKDKFEFEEEVNEDGTKSYELSNSYAKHVQEARYGEGDEEDENHSHEEGHGHQRERGHHHSHEGHGHGHSQEDGNSNGGSNSHGQSHGHGHGHGNNSGGSNGQGQNHGHGHSHDGGECNGHRDEDDHHDCDHAHGHGHGHSDEAEGSQSHGHGHGHSGPTPS